MMQDGSLWTMVNFMLCSTEYKLVKCTWNSVEYGHGVWAQFRGASCPGPFSGRDREPQHVASAPISYQKRTAGIYWFLNAVWALDSGGTVTGTSQVDKIAEMKILSSQPLWKGDYNHRKHLQSWSSSPVSVSRELLTEAHPKAKN